MEVHYTIQLTFIQLKFSIKKIRNKNKGQNQDLNSENISQNQDC